MLLTKGVTHRRSPIDGSLCRDVPRGVEEEGALLAAVPGAGRVLRRQQQPVPVRPHLDSTARLDHPHVHAHRRHHPLLQGMALDFEMVISRSKI